MAVGRSSQFLAMRASAYITEYPHDMASGFSQSGWSKREGLQVGCMRQVLGPGALGRPRGIGWGGRWEGGSGWGTHVNPWLIHVNV